MKILVTCDIRVCARFRAADQHTVFQTDNNFTASESGPAVHDFHVMPAGSQAGNDFLVFFLFNGQGSVSIPLPSRCIQSHLRIQVEIDRVHNDLNMSLGLHISAHDAEWADCFAVFGEETGDDRMI